MYICAEPHHHFSTFIQKKPKIVPLYCKNLSWIVMFYDNAEVTPETTFFSCKSLSAKPSAINHSVIKKLFLERTDSLATIICETAEA